MPKKKGKEPKGPSPEELAEREAAAEVAHQAAAITETLKSGSPEQKEEAAYAFCEGGSLPCYRFCPSEIASPLPWIPAAIPPLVALLARECTVKQKENAATALYNLAAMPVNIYNPHEQPIVERIVAAGGVPPLVALVRDGPSEKIRESAAGALHCCANLHANRTHIAASGGIPPLLTLARDGTDAQKELAVMALGFLCFNHVANRVPIVKAGGVELLTELTKEGTEMQKQAATYALRNVTVPPPTAEELARLKAEAEAAALAGKKKKKGGKKKK